MKKRRIVTIDELMSMSQSEIDEYIERSNSILEGTNDDNESMTDLIGMSIDDIIVKYNCKPIDEVYHTIMNKLTQTRNRYGNKLIDGNGIGCVFEIDEKSPNCDVITKDFTEDEMKNDISDLTEIPMEVLDKSYVRYEPYNLGITHRHPLRKKNKL